MNKIDKILHWLGFHGRSAMLMYIFHWDTSVNNLQHSYFARICEGCKRSIEYFTTTVRID